jgi:phage terminase large subunit
MFIITTALRKLRKLRKRVKVVQGGTSASKTFSILPILIDKAIKEPGLEISVVSESVPHLKRGALKDFLKIMKETGRFIPENYNISDRKYTFSNGSYMEFFSPDSILGARRTHLFINECNNISFADYHQLAIRTSTEIWLDYNPAQEFWVQTEVMKDPDTDFIILTYKDNEALDPAIIREIEKAKDKEDTYWQNWWKVYGLGQLGVLEGVIFGFFSPIVSFPADCDEVFYGMDFGYTNDPTTLIKVGIKGDHCYLQQLIYSTGLLNSDISDRLKTFEVGRKLIIADNAEPKTIEDLRRRGWNIKPAEKGKDSIAFGIQKMKEFNYSITSESLDLIKEWRGYSWKKDHSINRFMAEPIEHLNHCIDAIRYAIMNRSVKRTGKYNMR